MSDLIVLVPIGHQADLPKARQLRDGQVKHLLSSFALRLACLTVGLTLSLCS